MKLLAVVYICHEQALGATYIVPARFQAKLDIASFWRSWFSGWSVPNKMTMKERFIEALPGRIERVLTVSRGLHQRRDPLAVFVKSAREIEEAIEGFQSRRGDGSQSRPSAPTGTRPSSASKGKRRAGPPRPSNSTVQPPRQELPARRDTRPPPRAGNAGQRGPARFKDSSSKPTTFRAGPSTSQSKPTVKCYKCGGMGHISTDPKCVTNAQ